jgi:transcriptional regulator with XRE-family HTH domain
MADPIDIYVGKRLRLKRKVSGFTQSDIGDKIGTTFQQVQKYEKGENRISASKLYQIAQILNTTVSFFFEGYSDANQENVGNNVSGQRVEFAVNKDSVDLIHSFNSIKDSKLKKKLKVLIDSISETE